MILNRYERMVAKRYLLPGKGEGFIFLVAGISLVAVALGVAALIIVMSVMNGFRAELFDKIVGLNGHAVVQGYGGKLEGWRDVVREAQRTPGVTSAVPLIEQPLFATHNGRSEAVLLRGMRVADIRSNPTLKEGVLAGDLATLRPGSGNVALGARLAENMGATVGSTVSVTNLQGRATPFGTVPRSVPYTVSAIFTVGVHEFDGRYTLLPMEDAQELLLLGDAVGMVEVETRDADQVGSILAPLAQRVSGRAVVADWRQMNSALFEALEVERVAMFVVLSIIILVAVFNIVSSLTMLARMKSRDIAILRTMGASSRAVLKVFMTIGIIIGALGIITGLILGAVFLYFRQSIANAVQLLTGQQLWDPSIRFLTELPSKTDPLEVTAIIFMALLFSFLAPLYPAFRAASPDPVQVLRYECGAEPTPRFSRVQTRGAPPAPTPYASTQDERGGARLSGEVLAVTGLKRSFTQADVTIHVLRGIDLQVRPGEIVALLGPSGSGKSTLLQAVGLLEGGFQGSIRIAGEEAASLNDEGRTRLRREALGFVYQFHHLLPDFDALENVTLPQLIRGALPGEAEARGRELLTKLGLGHRLHHRPSKLSGGEQQRVAVARALANRPALVLADEPTGNLDEATADVVLREFLALVRGEGSAALVATHNERLAAQMDRLVRLHDGIVEDEGMRERRLNAVA